MTFAEIFETGLPYGPFLDKFGSEEEKRRWGNVHGDVALSAAQREVLSGFRRRMKVLCLAGAWCGDCVNQCPIFDHFAAATETIQLHFFDRDDSPALAEQVRICGGARVPAVVFLSEDGQYGDRTISKYRQMAADQLGASCPTGLGSDAPLLQAVTADWLEEFERIQLMLRTSPRLRQLHGD